MAQRGIDTIIVRAFHNTGDRPLIRGVSAGKPGVYFATEEAPVTADLLGEIVRIAHGFNLKVFAWMTTRRSEWLIHRRPDWLEHQYDFTLGRSLPSRGLSIFHGSVRKKLGAVLEDLARTGVDGLLFQDDMIMRHNEGFSSLAKQLFLMDAGLGVHPDDLYVIPAPGRKPSGYKPLFWKWCRWKVSSLLSFMDEIVAGAMEINPSLLVAVNIYYESILSPDNALAWYAQDVKSLLKHDVDYLALMSYHRQMKSELSLNEAQLEALFEQFINRTKDLAIEEARIIFKIQTLDWETNMVIPAAERENLLQSILEAGSFSTALLQNLNH
jgi:biofilm PGA synthesis lipoprotein PgaB